MAHFSGGLQPGGFSGCFLLFFFFFGDRCLKEKVGMAEVGCELWLGPVFGSLVVVGSWLGSMFGLWVKWVVGRRSSLVFGFGEVMVRSAWVTVMSLVEIGVGHRMVSWFFWVLPFLWFFFFFFNKMGFCLGGILVGNG